MPAFRLDDVDCRVGRFDVAGLDASNESEFVRHVGLVGTDRERVNRLTPLPLTHMGPPLSVSEEAQTVESIGTAELNADELEQIRVFIEELSSEYEAERVRGRRQYVIHPHVREPDDIVPCRRFSCAGFVIEAYRDAGIELLDVSNQSFPVVPIEMLARAYPDQADRLTNPSVRAMFGLAGDGPWPVVLAGYVINALARARDGIVAHPHLPVAGEAFFPRRTTA